MASYNGWSNYETWRTNLELFDGMTAEDMGLDLRELREDVDANDEGVVSQPEQAYELVEGVVSELASALEEQAYELVEMEAKGWALDLAKSFLNRVDFQEIAQHMVDDFISENN